ncbi:Hypothetical protein SMAX5B_015983 [Scophthalmus maximus]|uniref:Uncharacterized protein n=1 Tax=Scophthalmus maximus TaxID=52904 RepID=A0A2U9AWU6_SCOMX|nr:Hypothetical protein SMAX5B_015983 [Scophthalmus maximus]
MVGSRCLSRSYSVAEEPDSLTRPQLDSQQGLHMEASPQGAWGHGASWSQQGTVETGS